MDKITDSLNKTAAGDALGAKKALRAAILEGPGFEALSKKTGLPPKSLIRMVSGGGNPTLANLALIYKALLEAHGTTLKVELHRASKKAQRERYLNQMAQKYFWWERQALKSFPRQRVLAQVMDIGELDDTRDLHRLFSKSELRETLKSARPGWFHKKSWHYWHRMLLKNAPVPPLPARRFS